MDYFPHIRVVDASAGSGKTWQLTQRYIHLLFNIKTNPNNILAITFTNDAANEMKYRILNWLKKSALGDKEIIASIKSSDTLGFLLNVSESAIKEKAAKKVQEILRDYLNFNVKTIDSFINSIASSSSLDIGLPPSYEITMNPLPYIKYVIDLLLSRVGAGSAESRHSGSAEETELFDRFLNSYLTVEKLKSWQPKKVIQENVNELRKEENIHGLKFEKFSGRIGDKEEILEILKKERTVVSDKRMLKAIENTIANGDLEKMGNWIDRLSLQARKKIEKYFYNISSMRFNSYIAILDRVRDALDEIEKRKRIIFMDELGMRIDEYLKNEGVVPEIYYMLGDIIYHYLIDEFQDTNKIQWDNLKLLIENSLAQGGSLFYVGDKKQALYRFRGGDVGLFDKIKDDFPSVESAEKPLKLKDNFRSRRNIVEFNNRIFSIDNLEKNSSLDKKSLKVYEDCKQKVSRKENPEGGYVYVRKVKGDNLEEIGENLKNELLLKLENIVSRHSYGDIAILVPHQEDVRNITNWLVEKNYQVASEITMDLRENSFINEIVGFLRFLNSPGDNLSFSSFISGEAFRFSSGFGREEIFSFIQENRRRNIMLYVIFREKYPEIWKGYIEPFFKHVGFLPPYDLVFEILKVYRIFEKFNAQEGFFMRLLEIIKEREDKGENSLPAFLDYWNEGENEDFQIVLPRFLSAIRVCTIHKAKGLSFPVVLIAFIERARNVNRFVVEKDRKLMLKHITKGGNYPFSSSLREIYDKEDSAKTTDILNSLYVALTRAEDEMFIFMPSKNNFSCLFDEGEGEDAGEDEEEIGEVVKSGREIGEKPRPYPEESEKAVPIRIEETFISLPVPLSSPHWSERLCREKIDIGTFVDLERRKNIERGDFIHYVLSKINKIEGDVEEIIKEKIRLCTVEKDFKGDTEEIIQVLSKLFSLKEIKELFSFDGFNEKDIIGIPLKSGQSNIFRIDRLIITPERICVIEYKTGEESLQSAKEKHLKQVSNYINTVKAIYGERKIEGYLIYVDEGKTVKI